MNKKYKKYLIVFLIFIILITGLTIPFLIARFRLTAEVNQLSKEGLSVTGQQFGNRYYKAVPDEQNAAPILIKAFALYKEPADWDKLIIKGLAPTPWLDQKIAPELLAIAKADIDSNKGYFNEIAKIKDYRFVRFDYNWKKYFLENVTRSLHTNDIRKAIKNYELKTVIELNYNNRQDVDEYLMTLFHLSDLAIQNPTTIGQLTSYACIILAVRSLERCINKQALSCENLKKISDIMEKQERLLSKKWSVMLEYEILNSIYLHKLISSQPLKMTAAIFTLCSENKILDKISMLYYYYSGTITNDTVNQIKSLKKIIKIPDGNYNKTISDMKKIINDPEQNPPVLDISFVSSCLTVYQKMTEMTALLRSARTACAVERFRLKYGRLPENLKQLVPLFLKKIPVDPFDGKSLRYFKGSFPVEFHISEIPGKENNEKTVTIRKDGFYVYSIGRDLRDNIIYPITSNSYKNKNVIFTVVHK